MKYRFFKKKKIFFVIFFVVLFRKIMLFIIKWKDELQYNGVKIPTKWSLEKKQDENFFFPKLFIF